MRVTIVGSGDAFHGGGRLHSCYLLEASETEPPLMVDFGATALVGLHQLGRKASDIHTFTFTHLHGDHLSGVPFLVIDSFYSDVRTTPLRLVGPPGLEARVQALIAATYGLDLLSREGAPTLIYEEVLPGESRDINGVRMQAYPAAHMDPPDVPLCLRFTGPQGETVTFSGDTEMCAGLLEAATDADLVIAECSSLAPPAGRHCTWEDWKRTLPSMTARRVILTHLGRDVRAATPKLVSSAPQGPRLDFADDGLVFEVLPTTAVPE